MQRAVKNIDGSKRAQQSRRPVGRPAKHMREKLLCSCAVWLLGFFHCVDHTHQFLCGMRECNIVVLSLGSFLGKVSGEGRIPEADIRDLAGITEPAELLAASRSVTAISRP